MDVLKANMTSFVQPCDEGIIRCFKAGYRKTYCAKALNLDEAGKRDIYSINLLKGVLMAKAAWEAVTSTTIHHCWDHSQIQLDPFIPTTIPYNDVQAHANPIAWGVMREFAVSDSMTLPIAKACIKQALFGQYLDGDQRPALNTIMDAEGDAEAAIAAVKSLANLSNIEDQLKNAIGELKSQNCIFGKPLTVDEVVDPAAERLIDKEFALDDREIVAEV
ncbi:hypothetical protein SERLADRAFT_441874 [Serpula lacrymans var. lacrymans S7.9]|uniref:DDE-1 domain-containing protein n=1 Tax=Serpula lacrymans var. lacrymans (strain S7.9) TaxID=578457 RepID=F8P7X1_SERL9|nr:uncharacterized protein SERLADRAFT_441874 [Serpula lacrymans var. lacrymans S7.9]EGO20529.1 hypothetical protein SERLADRAFT_441874 [Serpula lacrymans var. lacrymans S7.9]